MKRFILFGAGRIGQSILQEIGKERVICFIDNDIDKQSRMFEGIKVYSLDDIGKKLLKKRVVLTLGKPSRDEVALDLENKGISYIGINEMRRELALESINNRPDNIETYKRAINWIKKNTISEKGIINNSGCRLPYPEVTGYYIPTLLRWGYRDFAVQYAKWLCSIQKKDGSWYDTYDKAPYIFDTAQILKGLIAVRDIFPRVDENIRRGCDWIISRMQDDGRLLTPTKEAWGSDKNICDEVIHIYCLSPLIDAGKIYDNPNYKYKAMKSFDFYYENYRDKIYNFGLLSHFHAYLMEALIDLGKGDIASEAMHNIAKYQIENGSVPAFNNVKWVCSTGLFQLSMVWFRLNDIKRGEQALAYACSLQNKSGGWYGSYINEDYPEQVGDYFPENEISWANKFFLDALYYRGKAYAKEPMGDLWKQIDKDDGRYLAIRDEIGGADNSSILDVGCGMGRYLYNLLLDFPSNKYYGVDLVNKLTDKLYNGVEFRRGLLTCIPFDDDSFDYVYTVEAMEHAVDIDAAIREMSRVTKSGGRIVILDKTSDKLGSLEIDAWEQWFDRNELKSLIKKYCTSVKEVHVDTKCEETDWFCMWVGTVMKNRR